MYRSLAGLLATGVSHTIPSPWLVLDGFEDAVEQQGPCDITETSMVLAWHALEAKSLCGTPAKKIASRRIRTWDVSKSGRVVGLEKLKIAVVKVKQNRGCQNLGRVLLVPWIE